MSRDTLKSLREVIGVVASRKSAAAAYRAQGKPEGVEDSRTVYLSACATIAQEFQGLGFRFAKSKARFGRAIGDFTCTVSFQSSHHNIPGQHVQLWVHATVRSGKLLAFRECHVPNTRVTDHVAGGMVHLLIPNGPMMIEWELANPDTRPATIVDVVDVLQTHVLPYFAMFETPGQLISRLEEEEIPAFDLQSSVEFALCFGDTTSAQKILSRFLRQRSDLLPEIARIEREGLRHPHHGPSGYAEAVVCLRREFGLR